MRTATRSMTFVFGLAAGMLGMEHGYFEALQGPVAPDSILIHAIGAPCQPITAPNGVGLP